MTPSVVPPHESAGYVPWWLLAIITGLMCLAAAILAVFTFLTRTADQPAPTATVMVVTALPPVLLPTATFTLLPATRVIPTEAPTLTPPPPPPGEVGVGAYVQVSGTGETGFLNLRAEPNLSSPVNYLAIEREVFQVQAGPAEASGLIWWYLVDPATNTKFGWAAQNYLQVVQGP